MDTIPKIQKNFGYLLDIHFIYFSNTGFNEG